MRSTAEGKREHELIPAHGKKFPSYNVTRLHLNRKLYLHMNIMVWNSQRTNEEQLSFPRWKEILVLIELSVEVQHTKLKLVQSHHSNIFEKLAVAYGQNISEFLCSRVEMIFVSLFTNGHLINCNSRIVVYPCKNYLHRSSIWFSKNVFSMKRGVHKNLDPCKQRLPQAFFSSRESTLVGLCTFFVLFRVKIGLPTVLFQVKLE